MHSPEVDLLKFRNILGQPNARVSKSSDIVPYARPCFTSCEHCGSAYDGDKITGRPINSISF